MFTDTLLESSPSRIPLLRRRQYACAATVGAIGSLARISHYKD